MTATYGPFDRTSLNELSPNLDTGDVADPALRLAYFQYLADYGDAMYSGVKADIASKISAGALSALGIINVKDYGASGSNTTTTGNLASGSKVLVVTSTDTFEEGHGVSVAGAGEAGADLVTSITSIVGTNVFLADEASTTVSGAMVSHDDTAALLAARDSTISSGGIFYIPATVNCCVSGDLDLFGVGHVQIEGTITGADTTKILTLGLNSAQVTPANYFVNTAASIMVRFTGLKNADVKVNYADYMQLWADGDVPTKTSIAYSRFEIGKITKLEFNSQGTAIGWINENVFYGGRIVTFIMDGNYQHNNNTFYKPMLEGCTMTFNKGQFNQFFGCRFEGTNSITFAAGTTGNKISKAWYSFAGAYLRDSVTPSYTDNGVHNIVCLDADADHSFRKLFEVNVRSNNYNVSDFTKNEEDITSKSFRTLWASDFIKITRPIGFKFSSDAALFRGSIYLYDSTKTLITVQPAGYLLSSFYTWSVDHYAVSSTVSFVSLALLPNSVDSNIAYVKISFQAYAAGTFEWALLQAIEQKRKETSIPTLQRYTRWNSAAIPAAGVWEVGDIVWNNTPTASGKIGWVCTASGSPGTWKGFGAIDA